MNRYTDLLADAQRRVREIQPWDLRDLLARESPPLVLDIREPAEFARARIAGALNVPRGVLEQACEWDFEETVPLLASRRDVPVVVVCRSGNRSLLAANVMRAMGFGPAVIGKPWAKRMGPGVRADFDRLRQQPFVHALSGHGTPIRDNAKALLDKAIAVRFGA